MKWRKLGLVYAPSGELWWARNYAILPTADIIDEKTVRIYFASLDENRFGRVGYVEIDADNPRRILYETKEPVLDIGEFGTFDDSGVNPSCVISFTRKKYLYYLGWQRCERVPYMIYAGLAISDDELRFQKVSHTPVLERTHKEPFLRSAISVLHDNGILRAWYVSGLSWTLIHGSQYPKYVIRYAESSDGTNWVSSDHICINFKNKHEFGLGRPWVLRDQDTYKMWYSIRSEKFPYTIGYAKSKDGISWERKDEEVGIYASESGWDAEMICYPCVLDVNGKRYMFYNGNRHGSTGFGCAILESD